MKTEISKIFPESLFVRNRMHTVRKKITLAKAFHINYIYIIVEQHQKKKINSYKVVPCSLNQRQFSTEAQKPLPQKIKKDT